MSGIFKVASVALVTLGLSGCASYYSLRPLSYDNNSVRFERGISTSTSLRPDSAISITPVASEFEGRPVFFIRITNTGDRPFNVGTENIDIISDREYRVFSYFDMSRERRREAAWNDFLNDLNYSIELANNRDAATSIYSANTTVTGVGRYYGMGGAPYGANYSMNMSTRSTRYDPGMERILQAQSRANYITQSQNIEANLNSELSELQANYMQTNTVDPGQSFSAFFVVDRPKLSGQTGREMIVEIQVAGDEHAFRFGSVRH